MWRTQTENSRLCSGELGCAKKTAPEKERSAGLQCGGTCVSCAALQNEQSGDGMEQAWGQPDGGVKLSFNIHAYL